MKIKSLLLVIAALALTAQAKAQSDKLQIGVFGGISISDFSRSIPYTAGIAGTYEFGISNKFALVGDVGYQRWYNLDWDQRVEFIPIQIGARYYLKSQFNGLYAGLIGGMNFSRLSFDDSFPGRLSGYERTDQGYSITPSIGYVFGQHFAADLGAYYAFYGANFVDMRLKLVYSFNL